MINIKLIEIEVPDFLSSAGDIENVKAYTTKDGLHVLMSTDNTRKWGKLKHVSISRIDRYPSWDEILVIKNQLFGDTDVMMVLPKQKDYVNIHNNIFHLWKTPEGWEIR